MAQEIIDQLQTLCDRLREKLMQQPEYRALMSLERTIEDVSACMDTIADLSPAHRMDPVGMETDAINMKHGANHMADVIADALRDRKKAIDHLPSHRVA
jgi:hypothetical protein